LEQSSLVYGEEFGKVELLYNANFSFGWSFRTGFGWLTTIDGN
jgi:hypothetical protein